MSLRRAPRPYADTHLTGVMLGLVLLAAYATSGRGLGASGAFAAAGADLAARAAPVIVDGSPFLAEHVPQTGLLGDWLVVELIGVAIGGFLSALVAGRLAATVERGAGVTTWNRLALAGVGGVVMGVGAVLARGCTSGQALTGGALLSVGSWLFMGAAFAGAFALAGVFRWAWS